MSTMGVPWFFKNNGLFMQHWFLLYTPNEVGSQEIFCLIILAYFLDDFKVQELLANIHGLDEGNSLSY